MSTQTMIQQRSPQQGKARPPKARRPHRPSLAALALARIGVELRSYRRQPDTVFFTFLFPVMMLCIFATAFSNLSFGPDDLGLTAAGYYLPAMLASGVLLSGFQNLGSDLAVERYDGTRRRLALTPLPVAAYLLGKLGLVLITALVQAVLLIAVARFAFDVPLPDSWSAWTTLIWVFLLGLGTSVVLGFLVSYLPRSAKSATAVILPPVLILQFVSGVYLQFSQLPEWLQNVASVFPLKWIAQGFRAALLPDQFAVLERGEAWHLGLVATVLAVWFVSGLVVTLLTFRWVPGDRR
ncbi:ABC transporter permease [Pseudoclavibacter sp. CFCC 13611]|uniref:ABC transporter permease n=1 Tax=Pseudoclavibacter sp. CFCC 13611 TaxID=2615178 RepID=UPI001CE45D13|nr:ABC transporter permease [Pseudoclavibacter sp. CFCC 13611]